MKLRKRFRDWCPQPPDRLPTKLKRYSMPIVAIATVTLILSVSFFVFSSSLMYKLSEALIAKITGDGEKNEAS